MAKKTKTTSRKNRKKNSLKNSQRSILPAAFLIAIILAGIFYLILSHSLNKTTSAKINPTQTTASTSAQLNTVATPAASLKKSIPATHSAVLIPQASGRTTSVPVLYYHYIANNPNPKDTARDSLSITPDRFEEEMSYLSKNGYTSISLDTLYAALKGGGLPAKPVALTFDDGYEDFYYNAFPILRKYNIHATVFIPTGLMGGSYYLTWPQIKEMDASGLISFEAHSINHVNLAALSGQSLKDQIIGSKAQLEAQLGHAVHFFAYPYGTSSSEAWSDVKNAGFLAAWGTWYSRIASEGNVFDLPRERMGGAVDIQTFAAKL